MSAVFESRIPFNEASGLYVPDGAPDISLTNYSENQTCYSFSLNIPELGDKKPGDLNKSSGREMELRQVTKEWLTSALLEEDGLEEIDRELVDQEGVKLGKHVIAAFHWHQMDCHFAVLGADGAWYDKMGDRPPRKMGHFKTEDLHVSGYYMVGTFCVPNRGVVYTP